MVDHDLPRKKEPLDYTGVKIGAALLPVFAVFAFLGHADMGLTVCIVLGMVMLAIKIRWGLRKHVWFWAIIVFILALHVPLFLIVRWPQGSTPTLFYTLPLGIMDFLVISGALWVAENLLSRDDPSRNNEKG